MISLILTAILAAMPPLVWRAEGRAEAERDITADAMKWKVYGYMAGLSPTDETARVKLRERFRVELTAVAQCVVSMGLVERSEGYNDRIREEIERKHGPDAISQVWDEANEDTQPENVATRWFVTASIVVGLGVALWLIWRAIVRRQ